MGKRTDKHWADRVAEIGGASALAIGFGGSAWLLLPVHSVVHLFLTLLAAVTGGLIGWIFVRRADEAPRAAPLPSFALEAIPRRAPREAEELLLDVAVPALSPSSRVVSLFGGAHAGHSVGLPETHNIPARDSGLGESPKALHAVPDASDALFDALADLRRSLRQG